MGKYLDLVHEAERHVGMIVSTSDASVDESLSRGTNAECVESNGATTLTTETTEAPLPRAVGLTCYSCRRHSFWISVYGVTICSTCHPPANPSLVAKWITTGEPSGA